MSDLLEEHQLSGPGLFILEGLIHIRRGLFEELEGLFEEREG
jgi:hypothetical protein